MSPGPYHLLSLGTLLLLSYFISLLMHRLQLVSRLNHRKIWNTLLLLFFLSTAVLGLLLVLKVNYKLNFSWIEEAMQWHVDSGIGFSLIAIFHLLWHIPYYLRKRGISNEKQADTYLDSSLSYSRFQSIFLFILLGYISIMAQLVLLREFLKSFHGNELVIGIFLAFWMILTALGANLGSKYSIKLRPRLISLLLVTMSGLPMLIYLLLILVNRFLFLPGLQPGILDTLICILLLAAPFTMLSGFLFGYVSRSAKNEKRTSPYMLDALGSVAGGILFAALLVHLLNNLQVLTLLFLSSSAGIVLVYHFPLKSSLRWMLLLGAALLFILSLVPGLQNELEEIRFRNEELIISRDTPYGNLSFTEANEQLCGYMDGNPVITSSDLTVAEESVHFPALQLHKPESFLLLGGGLSGHISEAAKYNPDVIDYCEADPWIYRLGQSLIEETSTYPFRFIPEDGRSWLMRSGETKYDVIISSFPNPQTLGSNRYFTLEFFRLVKKHLAPGGVFCMHLTTADSYVNEEGLQILGINDRSLREVFPEVLIVPGTSTYFLASAYPLSLDFPALLTRGKISTTYVHSDYLDANHMRFDSDLLAGRIQERESPINSDLWPRLFFASLMRLQSKSGKYSMEVAGILAALLFFFLMIRYTPTKRAMYVTGFTGAGIQITLIMVMQSFYGFAYMVAPLMITLFMSGLVAGILTSQRLWKRSSMNGITGLVLIMALLSLSGLLLPLIGDMHDFPLGGQLALGVLNFMPGMVVGWVYAMGTESKKESNPGIIGALYSADLTGAALGTLIPPIFLLPLIGIRNTFILFFCINLLTGISLMIKGIKPGGNG